MIRPLAIAGPSGVGKGTIVRKLLTEFPGVFGLSVSHTTRQPRPQEIHAQHYHFSTHEQMRHAISEGLFVEHAEVHGNIYGTSFQSIQNVAQEGRVCLLDIDMQGVRQLQARADAELRPWSVFVTTPSIEDLEVSVRMI